MTANTNPASTPAKAAYAAATFVKSEPKRSMSSPYLKVRYTDSRVIDIMSYGWYYPQAMYI